MVGFLIKVTEFQEKNKMTTYNMSVIFSPSFFRPIEYTLAEMQK